ncbi:amidohydrolase family protein, partial [Mycobacterium sp. E1386]|uniref:amidohydrolase family protein n=1 Tax=Mycobacterium sp. E1386 TaxID=1834126 RepID=UPI000AB7581F
MAAADLVVTGTVLTVDEKRPTAEALAVADGRIVAVGSRSEINAHIGPDTKTLDFGDGCVMPGFVEAHGHPLMEALALSDRIVDIRPVTLPAADDVVAAVRREVAARRADGAYLNGWDPLLQSGLPQPTLAWLDEIAPDGPLIIIHNSGHKAYFNSHAARRAGLTRDTPDPKGARYGRDTHGDLDGSAEETGAVEPRAFGEQHRRVVAGRDGPGQQREHRAGLLGAAVQVAVRVAAVPRTLGIG